GAYFHQPGILDEHHLARTDVFKGRAQALVDTFRAVRLARDHDALLANNRVRFRLLDVGQVLAVSRADPEAAVNTDQPPVAVALPQGIQVGVDLKGEPEVVRFQPLEQFQGVVAGPRRGGQQLRTGVPALSLFDLGLELVQGEQRLLGPGPIEVEVVVTIIVPRVDEAVGRAIDLAYQGGAGTLGGGLGTGVREQAIPHVELAGAGIFQAANGRAGGRQRRAGGEF